MSRIALALTLAVLCLVVGTRGDPTNSVRLRGQENDGLKSLENTHHDESASIVQPQAMDLTGRDCGSDPLRHARVLEATERTESIPYCDRGYEYDGKCCAPICEPGTYGRYGRCRPCRPGTFSSDYGAAICSPCPTNTVAPNSGSTMCEPCPGSTTSTNGKFCIIVCNFPTLDPVSAPTEHPVMPPVEPPVEHPVEPPVSPPNYPPFCDFNMCDPLLSKK